VNIGRVCKVADPARSMFYYKSKKDDTEVITKLETMVKELPTSGFVEYYAGYGMKGLNGTINVSDGYTG
jgi:putative transposase